MEKVREGDFFHEDGDFLPQLKHFRMDVCHFITRNVMAQTVCSLI
jgi:hypothetical protein